MVNECKVTRLGSLLKVVVMGIAVKRKSKEVMRRVLVMAMRKRVVVNS